MIYELEDASKVMCLSEPVTRDFVSSFESKEK